MKTQVKTHVSYPCEKLGNRAQHLDQDADGLNQLLSFGLQETAKGL